MNVFLDMVGCRLNQSEIEAYARQFRLAGHMLVASAEEADLVVLNTCSVTAAAAADSRQKIRQAIRRPAGQNPLQVVVTGCWSTLEAEAARALLAQAGSVAGRLVPNESKDDLVSQVLSAPPFAPDVAAQLAAPLPSLRFRTRAFVKVQDGCDNTCTFCITRLARGPGRSRPLQDVLADICTVTEAGAQEVVLTGVHLGSWGQDFYPARHLLDLLKAILNEYRAPRLRLSSVEPWDLAEDFFALWEDKRLCRHLHLPLQSGSAATLRRMARKTTPQAYAALVTAARRAIPRVAITTDIITGFPGESETEFAESLAFVQSLELAGGHVFTYSARPGTAAARLPGQVPLAVRKARNALMRQALAQAEAAYQAQFLGQQVEVLWEHAAAPNGQGWILSGLTDNYLRVHAPAQELLWNQLTPVRLDALDANGFTGQIV